MPTLSGVRAGLAAQGLSGMLQLDSRRRATTPPSALCDLRPDWIGEKKETGTETGPRFPINRQFIGPLNLVLFLGKGIFLSLFSFKKKEAFVSLMCR